MVSLRWGSEPGRARCREPATAIVCQMRRTSSKTRPGACSHSRPADRRLVRRAGAGSTQPRTVPSPSTEAMTSSPPWPSTMARRWRGPGRCPGWRRPWRCPHGRTAQTAAPGRRPGCRCPCRGSADDPSDRRTLPDRSTSRDSSTRPPAGVNFMALDPRLIRARSTWPWSTRHDEVAGHSRARELHAAPARRPAPAPRRRCARRSRTATSWRSDCRPPISILLSTSRSSISPRSRVALRPMMSRTRAARRERRRSHRPTSSSR